MTFWKVLQIIDYRPKNLFCLRKEEKCDRERSPMNGEW